MTNEISGRSASAVTDNLRGTHDALTVRRVFGDPYELDGVTVIPVARVMGGAGGGGGEGTKNAESGTGFGTGFGLRVQPIGVYQVRDGEVVWKPTVDAGRLAKGGQVLGGLAIVCATLIFLRRR
jgi:uncharacterized spore protein YtfJ